MLLSLLSAALAGPILIDVAPGCRCAATAAQPGVVLLSVLAVGMVVLARRRG